MSYWTEACLFSITKIMFAQKYEVREIECLFYSFSILNFLTSFPIHTKRLSKTEHFCLNSFVKTKTFMILGWKNVFVPWFFLGPSVQQLSKDPQEILMPRAYSEWVNQNLGKQCPGTSNFLRLQRHFIIFFSVSYFTNSCFFSSASLMSWFWNNSWIRRAAGMVTDLAL